MNNYKPVIGLEIHVELKTKSKMFCQCSADYFSKPANTHVCPVCLGLPGVLPVPNKKAIEWTIKIGQALNCKINKISKFDRKHYFYPDLPKGYQISQYDEPIAVKGILNVVTSRGLSLQKKYNIHRVHLEEDTGKLIHSGEKTLIDFNRSGVSLVEIVTEPDFDNVDDVKAFLEELQVIIRYLGVSDADMEKGTMRLEPNISIKVKSQKSNVKSDELPKYKVEIKNINSFRFVKQAIEYEIKRQMEILEKGEMPKQETRGFDEKTGKTYSQRSKEQAHDYRYFPEPDIPPMTFTDSYLSDIAKKLPELPGNKVERYVKEFGIKYPDAFILTRDSILANYFEEINSKLSIRQAQDPEYIEGQFKIQNLDQQIVNFIINKKISSHLSVDDFIKRVIELLTPKETDEKLLNEAIVKILEQNKKAVEEYKKGKENAIMFLVGQVMRELKGQADAKLVISKIKYQISK
jgi:aspartyl-tRNA(Asn)/glutamyl-tRNA(Gln) amidotransferase subunit B